MLEIEKKYLVSYLPKTDGLKQVNVNQGYLNMIPEVRIRMMDDEYFLTSKGDGTLIREEAETQISFDAFKILYSMVKGQLIEKTRVYVPIPQGYTAELDIYHGAFEGLMTVEVEFPREEDVQEFIPPIWFGDDITEDMRFKNKNLAMSFSTLDELLNKPQKKKTLE